MNRERPLRGACAELWRSENTSTAEKASIALVPSPPTTENGRTRTVCLLPSVATCVLHKSATLAYLLFCLHFSNSNHSKMDSGSPGVKLFSLLVLIRGYEEFLISLTWEIPAVFFLKLNMEFGCWHSRGGCKMLQFLSHSSGASKERWRVGLTKFQISSISHKNHNTGWEHAA